MPKGDATPLDLDLKRDERLRVRWSDGSASEHTIVQLRQLCPCARCRMIREGRDPHLLTIPSEAPPGPKRLSLSVMPASAATTGDVAVTKAEPVGNYALRLTFSDGHQGGIYSWAYLRELADA